MNALPFPRNKKFIYFRLIVKISPYQGPEVASTSFGATATEDKVVDKSRQHLGTSSHESFVKSHQDFDKRSPSDIVGTDQVLTSPRRTVNSFQTHEPFSLEADLALSMSQTMSPDRKSSNSCNNSILQNDQSSSTAVNFSNIISNILRCEDKNLGHVLQKQPGQSQDLSSDTVDNVLSKPDTPHDSTNHLANVSIERAKSEALERKDATKSNCEESLAKPSEQSQTDDVQAEPSSDQIPQASDCLQIPEASDRLQTQLDHSTGIEYPTALGIIGVTQI